MDRYSRNMEMLTLEENISLRSKKVAVIGCGGLGGYITEMLARLGVGSIVVADGDVFEESNLNRQLLSDTSVIGRNKALQAKKRISIVNPDTEVTAYDINFTAENSKEILSGCDIAMDALDGVASRLILQQACEDMEIPMVHGAISGWYGQISTIFPGERTLSIIYSGFEDRKTDNRLGNPSFTPALTASIQVSEALKIMISRGSLLRGRILFINTYDNSFDIAELSQGPI